MTRAALFGLGLITVSLFAYGIVSGEERSTRWDDDIRGTPQWAAMKRTACMTNGNVGREALHACMVKNEYDHVVPCCFYKRCDNQPSNLQLQPWPEARVKDKEIEAPTCREFHAGKISEQEGLNRFHREYR